MRWNLTDNEFEPLPWSLLGSHHSTLSLGLDLEEGLLSMFSELDHEHLLPAPTAAALWRASRTPRTRPGSLATLGFL